MAFEQSIEIQVVAAARHIGEVGSVASVLGAARCGTDNVAVGCETVHGGWAAAVPADSTTTAPSQGIDVLKAPPWRSEVGRL